MLEVESWMLSLICLLLVVSTRSSATFHEELSSYRGIVCINSFYDLLLVLNTFEHNFEKGFIEPFSVTIPLVSFSHLLGHSHILFLLNRESNG